MTLVEVLVATVLLAVGVTGLLFSAAAGMRNQQRTGERMAALYLAQEKLAEIDVVGPRMWSLTQSSRGAVTRESVTYEWSVAVEAMSEGELYDVRIEVSWSGAGGEGTVELETLLNDYEAVATLGPEASMREQPTETGQPAVR